ncbi:hypothetical protein [Paenibacillus ginsengarvi]|uniref:Uncharacterized protein n=1 Tax=Paenibacillus ginsengarvi TaxID=400777 RepID=A0A3B0C9Z0_9BACL|nr:hypothetical protein [Paenibacillus ginsengarvi]RKN80617.1 hypothetical protein D7M11_19235 [Paenibacillus ginsengarvi]
MNRLKWLLHLYPRSWRERYEEEFVAMLEMCPRHRWTDVFDMLLGAVDAHIQMKLQDGSNRLQSGMKQSTKLNLVPAAAPSAAPAVPAPSGGISARCLTCTKTSVLQPGDPDYGKMKSGPSKLYICKTCKTALKEEAILVTGLNPNVLDPMEKIVP